jgi:hypothetical protein
MDHQPMTNFLSLTAVPLHLHEQGVTVTYNQIWRAATEGRIPAERVGGRLFVKTDDLAKVASVFAPRVS